mgnify:CR=1 FL=1
MAGLLYVYAPYHLLDIYVRAAYAEFMLMLWFPWVFLAFDRLIDLGLHIAVFKAGDDFPFPDHAALGHPKDNVLQPLCHFRR